MVNTRSRGNPLIPFDHELQHILRDLRTMGDNMNRNEQHPVEERVAVRKHLVVPLPVLNFARPSLENASKAIVKPEITGNFELKEGTVRLVQNTCQFQGKPHEDPHKHLMTFVELSENFHYQNVSDEYVKLALFPFSLIGEAKEWLQNEPAGSITSWEILSNKFLNRFFSSRRTKELRGKISGFVQREGESLPQAWERYKSYLRDCPHHMQPREIIGHNFVEGLRPDSRALLDATAQGSILSKSYDEIEILLNVMAAGSRDYQEPRQVFASQKPSGMLDLDNLTALRSDISQLTNAVHKLVINQSSNQVQQVQQIQPIQPVCGTCGENHTFSGCPLNPESVFVATFAPTQVYVVTQVIKGLPKENRVVEPKDFI